MEDDKYLEECLDEVGEECEEWCHDNPFYEDCINECLQECIDKKKRGPQNEETNNT